MPNKWSSQLPSPRDNKFKLNDFFLVIEIYESAGKIPFHPIAANFIKMLINRVLSCSLIIKWTVFLCHMANGCK